MNKKHRHPVYCFKVYTKTDGRDLIIVRSLDPALWVELEFSLLKSSGRQKIKLTEMQQTEVIRNKEKSNVIPRLWHEQCEI
jgi:hypothetical protein